MLFLPKDAPLTLFFILTDQRHKMLQWKMLSSSEVIKLFLSKFHPNCQLENWPNLEKQVKFKIDITFEVVKIFVN